MLANEAMGTGRIRLAFLSAGLPATPRREGEHPQSKDCAKGDGADGGGEHLVVAPVLTTPRY
jgi:hypothetical protein